MSAHGKAAQNLAHTLFQLSLEGGRISPERVAGVLEYVERDKPANPVMVLKCYRRLIAAELAKEEANVEHAGAVPAGVLQSLSSVLGRKYGRAVTVRATQNPALIAGLRVRIGDDVYEASVAGQLAALALQADEG